MNLKLFLEEKARQFGERTAVVCNETRLSYAELDKASNKVANFLIKKGITKGDRVAILLPNSAEFVVIYLGVVKMGAISVPLDSRYKIDELDSLFGNCQPKALVAESECLEQLVPVLSRFASIKQIIEVGSRYKGRFPSYGEIMAKGSAKRVAAELDSESLAHIGYTSGPTSRPRGAMFIHRKFVEEATIAARSFQQTEKDIMILFALPMHHVMGLIVGLVATFVNGGKVVILPGLSLKTLSELMEKEKGTIFMGVPYVYVLMVRMAEQEGIKNDLSSLRLCISAGACLPDKTALRFKELYGLDIGQLWGLTEAIADVTCTTLDDTWKLGSAGRVLPGWEMKVVDDNGKELPVNQRGEILVRGPMMKGYYNNPEDTAEAITDGWLHTGDIGRIDEDGDLFILGLKKRMIIVKGQNIWPMDIEKVLHHHPQIAEAVVVGVADELRGETVGAAVRLKDGETTTEEDIKRFCRQYLINYKIPKRILFMNSLPKTADGQIRRETVSELLKLQIASSPPESQVKAI